MARIFAMLALMAMLGGCGEAIRMKTKVSSAATVTAEDCQCDCEIVRRVGTPMEE